MINCKKITYYAYNQVHHTYAPLNYDIAKAKEIILEVCNTAGVLSAEPCLIDEEQYREFNIYKVDEWITDINNHENYDRKT